MIGLAEIKCDKENMVCMLLYVFRVHTYNTWEEFQTLRDLLTMKV